MDVTDEMSVIDVRRRVEALARGLGFGIVEQTKLITAASELTRNILRYAGTGDVRLEALKDHGRSGVRLVFTDQGRGIADIDMAMQSGYTSGGGMGLGLPGAKRLVHEFSIESKLGEGTMVSIVIWKR